MAALLSTVTVASVGLTCKAFLNFGFCSVVVNGLPNLIEALKDDRRNCGHGVLTVANHISTLDDPVTWGVLPTNYYFSSRTTRWALGASDIMFTNPIFSTFFRLGQTLETFRGKGIHQPAVDAAIEKLDQGGWVHLYGEGKVNQPRTYSRDDQGIARLPRFKWGVGRVLMEAKKPPVTIPMWLTGFDQLMPEGRRFPYKYFPRPGAHLTITFGVPISPDKIRKALEESHSDKVITELQRRGSLTHTLNNDGTKKPEDLEVTKIRMEITTIIQREVETLGQLVSGDSLTGSS